MYGFEQDAEGWHKVQLFPAAQRELVSLLREHHVTFAVMPVTTPEQRALSFFWTVQPLLSVLVPIWAFCGWLQYCGGAETLRVLEDRWRQASKAEDQNDQKTP